MTDLADTDAADDAGGVELLAREIAVEAWYETKRAKGGDIEGIAELARRLDMQAVLRVVIRRLERDRQRLLFVVDVRARARGRNAEEREAMQRAGREELLRLGEAWGAELGESVTAAILGQAKPEADKPANPPGRAGAGLGFTWSQRAAMRAGIAIGAIQRAWIQFWGIERKSKYITEGR